ncbi:hypothetical protein B0H11DRAFT_1912082 [Mycena galericulata]|nr:hypothetical protein B0H11DRAFT_1912082 [Mycena galericulata]
MTPYPPDSTLARWTHPPFAGNLDDEGWIWGRGAGDSFGLDEEDGGVHSACAIAAHFGDVYGFGSVFLIVELDEGVGLLVRFGRTWVAPATVSVNVPGGRSSIPPAHTAIGILSALVTTIEAHPGDAARLSTTQVVDIVCIVGGGLKMNENRVPYSPAALDPLSTLSRLSLKFDKTRESNCFHISQQPKANTGSHGAQSRAKSTTGWKLGGRKNK